jgi:DNA-binding transcriptional LysR family regulator
MRGTEFAELRAFVEVVDQGSFVRAATYLNLAPSTLSQTARRAASR